MIVREEGDELVLVRQADHALLSGWLAGAWGAAPWQRPEPPEGTVLGARLHDLAWTPFDEAVPRRADGRPYPFQEVTRTITAPLYSRGLDAVEAIDPYAGLLASLHYSGFYHSHWGWRHWYPNSGLEDEEKDAVDRFVAGELARQRRLRDRLFGWDEAADRQLHRNYVWLQLWDRISLDICRFGFAGFSTDYPQVPVTYALDADQVQLGIRLEPGGLCRLEPYPLLVEPYRARIPCVRVPLAACEPGEGLALHRAWAAGGADAIEVTFRPAQPRIDVGSDDH